MTGDGAAKAERRGWRRRAVTFLIGFGISLIVGRMFELVSNRETLAAAQRVQSEWFTALSKASPFAVADGFNLQLRTILAEGQAHLAFNDAGEAVNVTSDGDLVRPLVAPFRAFLATVIAFVAGGGAVNLSLMAMGALAVGVINLRVSKGRSAFFNPAPTNYFFGPFAVIAAASVIALLLKALMLAALGGLSWLTSLAGAAAGATGVAGFCWYCVVKLGEKGAEHALTPRL
ncbi:MAG TPA: hypothetical protein DEA40_02095 [Parvularcula sp.]|nr:hypothetical protein [Parvularcula sp.]